MTTPAAVLERLRSGNARYAAGRDLTFRSVDASLLQELVGGQAPVAAILGCADSRVPVEMIFDQGPGDLFVVRVAGNVAGGAQLASLEFAIEQLGVRVVVVLGHGGCGAVAATLDAIASARSFDSPHLGGLVERVRPPIEALLAAGADPSAPETLARAVRSNVAATVEALRAESELIRGRAERGEVVVVGAEYSLETGVVDFLAAGSGG